MSSKPTCKLCGRKHQPWKACAELDAEEAAAEQASDDQHNQEAEAYQEKLDGLKNDMLAVFKQHLRLEVQPSHGGFTDPNTKRIVLMFDGEPITECSINVRQVREYEG